MAALVVGAMAAGLAACGGSAAPQGEASARPVRLQLNWFHEAEFVGYYVADAKGFYRDKGLDVEIREGGPGAPAIDAVRSGAADFAISSFGELKEASAKKEPLVAVMAGFQIPPLVIFSLADSGIKKPGDLAGKRLVVTAGGTQEPVDPVRYIGNRSSGKMGYALAEAARDRGAAVTLVTAPTSLADPPGIEVVHVGTAAEMKQAAGEKGIYEELAQAFGNSQYLPYGYRRLLTVGVALHKFQVRGQGLVGHPAFLQGDPHP